MICRRLFVNSSRYYFCICTCLIWSSRDTEVSTYYSSQLSGLDIIPSVLFESHLSLIHDLENGSSSLYLSRARSSDGSLHAGIFRTIVYIFFISYLMHTFICSPETFKLLPNGINLRSRSYTPGCVLCSKLAPNLRDILR